MKHDINDSEVRRQAVARLNSFISYWRACRPHGGARLASHNSAIKAVECALQALGADPDGPDTQPKPKLKPNKK